MNPQPTHQVPQQQQSQPTQLQPSRGYSNSSRGRGGNRRQYNPNNNGQQYYQQKQHANGQGYRGYNNRGYNPNSGMSHLANVNLNHHGNAGSLTNPIGVPFQLASGQPALFEDSNALLPVPTIPIDSMQGRTNWQPQMTSQNSTAIHSPNEPISLELTSGDPSLVYSQMQAMPYPSLPACSYYPINSGQTAGYPYYGCFQTYPPGYGYIPQQAFPFQAGLAGPTYPYTPSAPMSGSILCANCRKPQMETHDKETSTLLEQTSQVE